MFKKVFALILSVVLFGCAPVFADSDLIRNGDFEGEESAFTNILIRKSADGAACGNLKEENEADSNGLFLHKAEYLYPVHLTEGKIYTVSMDVAEEGSEDIPRLRVDYKSDESKIVFNIQNAGNQLRRVSGAFVAGDTGQFYIEISALTKSRYGILIDNISVTESDEVPVAMEIIGTRNAFVPPYDYETYNYLAVATDENGEIIPIIKGEVEFADLPDGVEISYGGDGVTVTNRANVGDTFTVKTVETAESMSLPQKEITVKLVNNYIENGDFEDYPPGRGFATESGSMEISDTINGNVAKITTNADGEEYKASISIEKTYVLSPGKMYVLRAETYSDSEYLSRYTTVSGGELDGGGYINVNISNPGGEPTKILSVIRVLSEGIYKIRLNFTNSDGRPVYIRDIGLYEEESKPSEILIKAPAHITIPKSDIKVPIHYTARDQEGNLLRDTQGISLKMTNANEEVYLEGDTLTVTSRAKGGRYTVEAESEDKSVSKKVYIEITDASIGDGSFEKYAPGEWFSTAEPSSLHYVSYKNYGFGGEGEKAARLTMGGAVSAVLSDSLYTFEAGEVYVLSGVFKPLSTNQVILSLLLCDVGDINFTDTVAVLQTVLKDGEMTLVFTSPRNMVARIMLGFTDESGGQTILFDNLKIEKAQISCTGVGVSGYPYSSRVITGRHTLEANFDAVEISTYRWLISKDKDGVYMPIEGQTDKSLSISGDMVNSYVKFEVTPISLNGPVFGESVTSQPVLIMELPDSGDVSSTIPEQEQPPEKEEIKTESTEAKGLTVVNIYSNTFLSFLNFVDIENHWARDDINLMSAASIVNGKKNQLFMPDEQITRAEFSAFIMRAFSLAPLYYTGTFDDVKVHHWYSGAVETVSKYGIANGVTSNLFMPDEPITREQIATIVMRAMALSGVQVKEEENKLFSDDGSISAYARDYVYDGVKAGIITGFPDGSFKPSETATRAEAIVLIKRMITYVLENAQ